MITEHSGQSRLDAIVNIQQIFVGIDEQTSQLATLIDTAEIGIWVIDLIKRTLRVNSSWIEVFGYEPTFFDAHTTSLWETIIHPEDLPIIFEGFSQLLASTQQYTTFEVRSFTQDTSIRWVHCRARISKRDDEHNPTEILGSLIDITSKKEVEEALKESEREKSVLLSNLPGLAYRCLYDQHWTMEYVSPGCYALTGYTEQEILHNASISYNELILDQYKEKIDKAWKKGVAQHQAIQVTYQIKCKDGTHKWVWEQGVPIFDAKGSVVALEGLILDISQRKHAEDSWKQTLNLMQYVIEHDRISVAVLDRQLCYLFVSHKFLQNFEKPIEDMIGKSHFEIFPDIPQRWKDVYDRVLSGEVIGDEDNIYHTPDGKECWNRWECRPWYEADGTIGGLIIYTEVVTDRKLMELELKKTKYHLEQLIEQASGPIVVWDSDGNITRCNRAFSNLMGKSVQSLIGFPIQKCFIPSQWTKLRSIVVDLPKTRTFDSEEFDITRASDGKIYTVLWNFAFIDDEYDPLKTYVIAQGQDITDRKKTEKQLSYLSRYDFLTGLYNRRYLEEECTRREDQSHLPLSVIMVDTNGLKIVNDSFGHAVGDTLLQATADVLRKGCREGDFIARYGGDEFVVLLSQTTSAETESIIQRCNALSDEKRISSLKVSMSYGYATRTSLKESFQTVFKRAEDSMYRNKIYESTSVKNRTIGLIMNTLFEKSPRELHHSKRVSELCQLLARNAGFSVEEINRMRIAGLMHDIGKIGIEESILHKSGTLNEQEWIEMKRHPEIGYRILEAASEFSEIANTILEHQERWDGKGYPRGLKGEEISLQARIIAVADAYDAMTSDRPYRKKLSCHEALEEIKACSGTQFDPTIATLFITILSKEQRIT